VAVAAAVLGAEPAPLTPELALDRHGLADVEASPDGTRVVFTVIAPVKGAARQRNIWVLDVASGTVRQLTFSAKSDGSPRWSPDGRAIAFLSDRDGATQLYRLPMSGGEAEKITDRKESISAFRWSPDGGHIALLMTEPKSDALQAREKDKDDARVVDKDDRLARVWMLDVGTHAIAQLTTAPYRIRQIEFAPDGKLLFAAATSKPGEDRFNEAIVAIDVKDGRFIQIAAPSGPMGTIAVSPDGRTIAYGCARVDGPDAHDLCLQPAAGGGARNATAAGVDRPVG